MNNILSRYIVNPGASTLVAGSKAAVTTDSAIAVEPKIDLLEQSGDAVEPT